MKIDLVMWTYNSAVTLDRSLPTIERAIPLDNVCHKIAVDGGSRDTTPEILRKYGWDVIESPRKGIPYQANHALGMVDTEFFASFEHDIIVNPTWFETTSKRITSEDSVGCVQGIRLYTGSKTMQAIEKWQYDAKLIPLWQYSVDNALFRTKAVKLAGGFSDECMASSDGILRRSMFKIGYRWITDYDLVSGHYRKNFIEQFKHQIKASELAKYTWSSNPESRNKLRRIISTLGGDPRYALRMAVGTGMLRVPIAWYILRYEKGLYGLLPNESKSVKPVAMDEWYLTNFKKMVEASRRANEASPAGLVGTLVASRTRLECQVCAIPAEYLYTIPLGWGNILPKMGRAVGQTFPACSDEHADKIAERVFRAAFEYVEPLKD